MILYLHSSHFNLRLLITTIFSENMGRCNHDPAFYGDDAADFNPGRLIDEHGSLIPGPVETPDDRHCTYGFGRP